MTEPAAYKELHRSRSDRMIAGVCGGLARYFDLNPAFFRVGFVVLLLLGGAGLLVYIAAALVIPEEGTRESVAERVLRERRDRPWPLIGLGLVALATVVLLSHVSLWPQGGAAWILLLLAGAVILFATRHESGASRRILRVLALVVLALVVLALVAAGVFASAFHVDVGDGVGTRTYEPTSYGDVHRKYRLGVGNLRIDLSHVSLPHRTTDLNVHVGVGDLRIVVPADASVHVDGAAQVGEVDVFDREVDGHNSVVHEDAGAGDRRLALDAKVGVGRLEVTRALP